MNKLKNKYASVMIGLLDRHEYYYGDDVEKIIKISDDAKKEITDSRIEKVILRSFPTKQMLDEYILDKKMYFAEDGITGKYNEDNITGIFHKV